MAVNDEALGFLWWDPQSSVNEQMTPLDAEIERRTIRTQSRDPEKQGHTPVHGAEALSCRCPWAGAGVPALGWGASLRDRWWILLCSRW